jgi:hypothetical protein
LGLILLTCNQIQHLFATLVAAPITHSGPPVALVVVATPVPGPRPRLPLPPAGQWTVNITNSGWSIRVSE